MLLHLNLTRNKLDKKNYHGGLSNKDQTTKEFQTAVISK